MTITPLNYDTGPAVLGDDPHNSGSVVGTFQYNGCIFSPLFATTVSGVAVKDNARRTVKLMEYTITADGYVTLPTSATSIAPTMRKLRSLLLKQAGYLVYVGRGFDLVVNPPLGAGAFSAVGAGGLSVVRDAVWGPTPELIEFQPLGGGASAKVRWQCKVRIFEGTSLSRTPLLQFNNETTLTYGEDGFSSLSIKGTIEIPSTRTNVSQRSSSTTVDDVRSELDRRIFRYDLDDSSGIDLNRFRVSRRTYAISRDKRTLEFDIACEEKPYMDLPPTCTVARGSYNVRPFKAGMGMVQWLCTLRATYTTADNYTRRTAWFAFLALVRIRMAYSVLGVAEETPAPGGRAGAPVRGRPDISRIHTVRTLAVDRRTGWRTADSIRAFEDILRSADAAVKATQKAFLLDFSFDEGLYLDSKTISFTATWRLITRISHILLASGLWRKVPEKDAAGDNIWALSIQKIMGSESWIANKLDPAIDVIVDFGGG